MSDHCYTHGAASSSSITTGSFARRDQTAREPASERKTDSCADLLPPSASFSAVQEQGRPEADSAGRPIAARDRQPLGWPLTLRERIGLRSRFDSVVVSLATRVREGAELGDTREQFAGLVAALKAEHADARRYGASVGLVIDVLLDRRVVLAELRAGHAGASGDDLLTELLDALCAQVTPIDALLDKAIELECAQVSSDESALVLGAMARTLGRADPLCALDLCRHLAARARERSLTVDIARCRQRIVAGLMHVPAGAHDRIRPLVGLACALVSTCARACADATGLHYRGWIQTVLQELSQERSPHQTLDERMGLIGYAFGQAFSGRQPRLASAQHEKVACALMYEHAASAVGAKPDGKGGGTSPSKDADGQRDIATRLFAVAHGYCRGRQDCDALGLSGAPAAIVKLVADAHSQGWVVDGDRSLGLARTRLMLSNLLLQPGLQRKDVCGVRPGLSEFRYLSHLMHVRRYMPLPPEFEERVAVASDAAGRAQGKHDVQTRRDAKAMLQPFEEVLQTCGKNFAAVREKTRILAERLDLASEASSFDALFDCVALGALDLRSLQAVATGLLDARLAGDDKQRSAKAQSAWAMARRLDRHSPEGHARCEALENAVAIALRESKGRLAASGLAWRGAPCNERGLDGRLWAATQ